MTSKTKRQLGELVAVLYVTHPAVKISYGCQLVKVSPNALAALLDFPSKRDMIIWDYGATRQEVRLRFESAIVRLIRAGDLIQTSDRDLLRMRHIGKVGLRAIPKAVDERKQKQTGIRSLCG